VLRLERCQRQSVAGQVAEPDDGAAPHRAPGGLDVGSSLCLEHSAEAFAAIAEALQRPFEFRRGLPGHPFAEGNELAAVARGAGGRRQIADHLRAGIARVPDDQPSIVDVEKAFGAVGAGPQRRNLLAKKNVFGFGAAAGTDQRKGADDGETECADQSGKEDGLVSAERARRHACRLGGRAGCQRDGHGKG
jgi:hypothetical protein